MGIGFKELLIILAIALLIFGAKRLRTIGSDLGGAVKGFKKAMDEGEDDEKKQLASPLVKGSDASPLVRGSDASPDPKDADSASTPPSGKTGGKSNA